MNDKAFSKTVVKKIVLKYWFTKIPELALVTGNLVALVTSSGNLDDTHYSICCFSKPVIWGDIYNNCFP